MDYIIGDVVRFKLPTLEGNTEFVVKGTDHFDNTIAFVDSDGKTKWIPQTLVEKVRDADK